MKINIKKKGNQLKNYNKNYKVLIYKKGLNLNNNQGGEFKRPYESNYYDRDQNDKKDDFNEKRNDYDSKIDSWNSKY